MSHVQVDNGDGTVTITDTRTGKTWPPIEKSEIERRKAAADSRRAEINSSGQSTRGT